MQGPAPFNDGFQLRYIVNSSNLLEWIELTIRGGRRFYVG